MCVLPFLPSSIVMQAIDTFAEQAANALEARGMPPFVSDSWVTRFIAYCRKYFSDPLIQAVPRAQDRQRAAVTPLRIAEYFYKLEKLFDEKKPRAVSMLC
jgi:hypothetical protein